MASLYITYLQLQINFDLQLHYVIMIFCYF